jgi:iron complex transport system substrate-binding protein
MQLRRLLTGGLAALILVGGTACGSDSDSGSEPRAQGGTETAAQGFPVTIEGRYGPVTVEKAPTRVVSVGYHEQDTLLALGVKPVAVREWFGNKPYALHPWAESARGDATWEVLGSGDLNFEQIAALRPDLIVATSALLEQAQYDKLSAIAPTLTEGKEYVGFGMPWQEITRTLGKAVGKPDKAEELVTRVEAKFTDAVARHPEFKGKTAVFGYDFGTGGLGAYASQDPRARILASLGFVTPDAVNKAAGSQFYAEISKENIDLLEADALLLLIYLQPGQKGLSTDPVFQTLEVVKEKRTLLLPQGEDLQGALSFSTVLSLPYAIDQLVPKLAAAIDGNPTTEP